MAQRVRVHRCQFGPFRSHRDEVVHGLPCEGLLALGQEKPREREMRESLPVWRATMPGFGLKEFSTVRTYNPSEEWSSRRSPLRRLRPLGHRRQQFPPLVRQHIR